jgi:hypothetical protein
VAPNPTTISGAITIPANVSYNSVSYTVTSIGANAFNDCDSLTSVMIANTVTSIGYRSFAAFGLSSISIPNSVTSIGDYAFSTCSRLQSISIPNSVTTIGENAFDTSGLISITIPNSVARIAAFTFNSCYQLESVSIGNSVTQIGREAFSYCRRLTSINIPNAVTAIGDNAFGSCQLSSLNIPSSVTYMGSRAFSDNRFLTSVNVNWATPLVINRNVFEGINLCNLSLNVPSGTETLYDSASVWNEFGGTSNLVPPMANAQTFCNTATVADLVATGQNLRWYNHNYSYGFFGNFPGAPDLTALSTITNLTSGIYYVAQSAGCKESARTAVTVTVNNSTAPTAVAQTAYSNETVADLVASGTNLQWYAAQTGGTALANAIPLATGTYYVSQTINNCESPRTAVAVTILPQYTAIPDNNFELALFNKGIDTVLGDNRVLTAAIINIPALDVSNKGIGDLTGIEAFYALTDLNCRGNFLTSLNITTVVLLQKLNCSENQIASLNLSNQTVLQLLRCEGNLLTTININGISALQEVYCSNNLMTTLDFRAQTNLQKLYCNNNRLTNLNVTGLTQLNQLGCNNNQLANLNVSDASLSLLNCGNNLLTNIDFRFQEPTLTTFNCQANQFSQMDLRGYNQLSNFNCTLNPNLNCISVDDVTYATANYQKDATASFSPNCFAPIVLNYCRGVIAPHLSSPFAAGVTSRWYTTAVGGRATLASPTPTTTTDGTRVYYVSQVSNGVESARIAITVNTLGLPGTPGAIAGTVAQGALAGTTTAASYSVAPVANATTYNWTVPAGVNIVSGQGTTTLTVNFNNVSAGAGLIGNLMVVAVNDLGCSTRAARILALTKALPAAPTAIRLTDAGVVTTSIAKYLGQPTVLTLTANPVAGVTTYEWELPAGVNVLSGALPVRGGAFGGNIITVNFEGVTTAGMFNFTTTSGILNHVLRIGVRSITGVGASTTSNAGLVNPTTSNTARLLTLTAVAPKAPSAIRMTDAMALDPTRAITVISTFIGTPKTLTLTATPVATANEYNWELPAGVKQLSGGNSNTITVNFAEVAVGTTSLYLGVKAMNGAGESVTSNASLIPATNSTARLLRLSASVPGTVPAVIGQVVGLCGTNAYTYTISPSALATSYEITGPIGSKVTSKDKATNGSNVIKTSDLEFTVVYPEKFIANRETPASITVNALNGVGTSITARIVSVSTSIPTPIGFTSVEDQDGQLILSRKRAKHMRTWEKIIVQGFSFNWTVNDGVEIISGQGTDEIEIDCSNVPLTIKSTKVSLYIKNSCGVASLPITRTFTLEPIAAKTAATLTIEATEVYPNPVVDDFTIDVTASKVGTLDIAIYSLEGIQVADSKTFELKEGANTITQNVTNLAKGIYIVQLLNSSNNEVITKKLIKN